MATGDKASNKDNKLHRLYEMEGRNTSSTDPKMMESRLFIGNLASDLVGRQDIEKLFRKYGKILGVSLHKSFGFVQFETKEEAENAVKEEKGKPLKGLKMDLCIATERRRDSVPTGRGGGGRRPPPPPPRPRSRSPKRRRDREWERDRDRWDWLDRRPSPPPPPRFRGGPIDPYRDPYYLRDDLYYHPRDDPYDRYPPIDPYDRYPPPRPYPRDYPPPPPPSRRDRYDSDPWGSGSSDSYLRDRDRFPPSAREDALGSLLSKATERKSTEMEIIVVSQQQKEYAQVVRQQVESIGVLVEMRQLSPTFSLLEALDSAAKLGFLYTIIITSQHESHRSVTLTILHGRNPQEHKNMPLGDAIGLIERDYDRYCRTGRVSGRSPPRTTGGGGDGVTSLMAKAATGGNLSAGELSTLISTLQQKHSSMRPTPEIRGPTTASAEDIQQQQADLQAKILSLLGSNAVVPPSKPAASPQNTSRRFGSGLDSIGSLYSGAGGSTGLGSSYGSYQAGHPYGTFH